MTNYVLLNNVEHANLKVIECQSVATVCVQASVLTFPTEFANIQKEYPILLSLDSESGRFRPVAMLGIKKNENLFVSKQAGGRSGWTGRYVPSMIARGPFMLGLQEQSSGGSEPVVYVDLDHPGVSESEGTSLFLEYGGNSPYLDYIVRVLGTIQLGEEVSKPMFDEFASLGLIEPLTVNIDLKNDDKYQISGYYTIDEKKLADLSGDNLARLNRAGYLQGAFLMVASLSNFETFIEMKNAGI